MLYDVFVEVVLLLVVELNCVVVVGMVFGLVVVFEFVDVLCDDLVFVCYYWLLSVCGDLFVKFGCVDEVKLEFCCVVDLMCNECECELLFKCVMDV